LNSLRDELMLFNLIYTQNLLTFDALDGLG